MVPCYKYMVVVLWRGYLRENEVAGAKEQRTCSLPSHAVAAKTLELLTGAEIHEEHGVHLIAEVCAAAFCVWHQPQNTVWERPNPPPPFGRGRGEKLCSPLPRLSAPAPCSAGGAHYPDDQRWCAGLHPTFIHKWKGWAGK